MIPGLHNPAPVIVSGATIVAVGGPLPERVFEPEDIFPTRTQRETYTLLCCTNQVKREHPSKNAQHQPFWRRFEKRRGKKRK